MKQANLCTESFFKKINIILNYHSGSFFTTKFLKLIINQLIANQRSTATYIYIYINGGIDY